MTEVVVNGLDVSYLREGRRVSDHGGGARSGACGQVSGGRRSQRWGRLAPNTRSSSSTTRP